MKLAWLCPALLLLGSCATLPGSDHRPAAEGTPVALGQAVRVGSLVATPQAVIEDSRCPQNVRCIWAGRLIVKTQVEGEGWCELLPLTLGEPRAIRSGSITLVSGLPEKRAEEETPSSAYRVAYSGGSPRDGEPAASGGRPCRANE